jgi:hypothetical protein
MTLEEELRAFAHDVLPTPEETAANNALVAYLRRKFFLRDLRRVFNAAGYVLIALAYLRDILLVRFAVRAFAQFLISNPFPVPSATAVLSDANKRAMAKFLLLGVLAANALCAVLHAVWGAYLVAPQLAVAASPSGGAGGAPGGGGDSIGSGAGVAAAGLNLLYGGLTLQFIGERMPFLRLELVLLDAAILMVQLVYHGLTCVLDDSAVLAAGATDDGYTGAVELVLVNVWANVRQVLRYEHKFEMPAAPLEPLAVIMGRTPQELQPPQRLRLVFPGAFPST